MGKVGENWRTILGRGGLKQKKRSKCWGRLEGACGPENSKSVVGPRDLSGEGQQQTKKKGWPMSREGKTVEALPAGARVVHPSPTE